MLRKYQHVDAASTWRANGSQLIRPYSDPLGPYFSPRRNTWLQKGNIEWIFKTKTKCLLMN